MKRTNKLTIVFSSRGRETKIVKRVAKTDAAINAAVEAESAKYGNLPDYWTLDIA